MREQEAATRQGIIVKMARLAEYIAYKIVELNEIAAEGLQLQVEEKKVRMLGRVDTLDHILQYIDIGATVSIVGCFTKYRVNQPSPPICVREVEENNKHKFVWFFKFLWLRVKDGHKGVFTSRRIRE